MSSSVSVRYLVVPILLAVICLLNLIFFIISESLRHGKFKDVDIRTMEKISADYVRRVAERLAARMKRRRDTNNNVNASDEDTGEEQYERNMGKTLKYGEEDEDGEEEAVITHSD